MNINTDQTFNHWQDFISLAETYLCQILSECHVRCYYNYQVY